MVGSLATSALVDLPPQPAAQYPVSLKEGKTPTGVVSFRKRRGPEAGGRESELVEAEGELNGAGEWAQPTSLKFTNWPETRDLVQGGQCRVRPCNPGACLVSPLSEGLLRHIERTWLLTCLVNPPHGFKSPIKVLSKLVAVKKRLRGAVVLKAALQ